mmetsp:Transcript_5530/g.11512  ORF Transcript_5530/g.11512 Transcript_5530/m.11512 type:complete len:203 (-) Transcript_5530:128-736(-)
MASMGLGATLRWPAGWGRLLRLAGALGFRWWPELVMLMGALTLETWLVWLVLFRLRERMVECQRFLTALSVRPWRYSVIFDHWFPSSACFSIMMRSSSSVQFPFFIPGFRWFVQRSRHCFPVLPSKESATVVQLDRPCCFTRFLSCSSSISVQDRLVTVLVFFFSSEGPSNLEGVTCAGRDFAGGNAPWESWPDVEVRVATG